MRFEYKSAIIYPFTAYFYGNINDIDTGDIKGALTAAIYDVESQQLVTGLYPYINVEEISQVSQSTLIVGKVFIAQRNNFLSVGDYRLHVSIATRFNKINILYAPLEVREDTRAPFEVSFVKGVTPTADELRNYLRTVGTPGVQRGMYCTFSEGNTNKVLVSEGALLTQDGYLINCAGGHVYVDSTLGGSARTDAICVYFNDASRDLEGNKQEPIFTVIKGIEDGSNATPPLLPHYNLVTYVSLPGNTQTFNGKNIFSRARSLTGARPFWNLDARELGDGYRSIFSFPLKYIEETTEVFVDGVKQTRGVDYTELTSRERHSTIQFIDGVPQIGQVVTLSGQVFNGPFYNYKPGLYATEHPIAEVPRQHSIYGLIVELFGEKFVASNWKSTSTSPSYTDVSFTAPEPYSPLMGYNKVDGGFVYFLKDTFLESNKVLPQKTFTLAFELAVGDTPCGNSWMRIFRSGNMELIFMKRPDTYQLTFRYNGTNLVMSGETWRLRDRNLVLVAEKNGTAFLLLNDRMIIADVATIMPAAKLTLGKRFDVAEGMEGVKMMAAYMYSRLLSNEEIKLIMPRANAGDLYDPADYDFGLPTIDDENQQVFFGEIQVARGSNPAVEFKVSGCDYIVNWGDGSIITYGEGSYCSHTYDFDTVDRDMEEDGFKYIWFRAYPASEGTIDELSFSKPDAIKARCKELLVNLPSATRVVFGAENIGEAVLSDHLEVVDIRRHSIADASYMFSYCEALRKIENLTLVGVEDTSYMYQGCVSLETYPEFSVSATVSLAGMYRGNVGLVEIQDFDTSSAEDTSYLFDGCSALNSMSPLNLRSATVSNDMFTGCYNLEEIELLGVRSAEVLDSSGSFKDHLKTCTLELHDDFVDLTGLFTNYTALENVVITNMDSVTDLGGNMGLDASKLTGCVLAGLTVSCDLTDGQMDAGALNILLESLGEAVEGAYIDITGHPGFDTCDVGIGEDKGWIVGSPRDWGIIPELEPGEQVVYGRMRIVDGEDNVTMLQAAGDYTVEWGDGKKNTYDSDDAAEHTYNFSTLKRPVEADGSKTTYFILYPKKDVDLISINMSRLSPEGSAPGAISKFRCEELYLNVPKCTSLLLGSDQAGGSNLDSHLQTFVMRENKVSNMPNKFYVFTNLVKADFDLYAGASSLKGTFYGNANLDDLSALNLVNIVNLDSTFEGCATQSTFDIINTGVVSSMKKAFKGASLLEALPELDLGLLGAGGASEAFANCPNLEVVDFKNVKNLEPFQSSGMSKATLRKARISPKSTVASLAGLLDGFNNIEELEMYDLVNITNADMGLGVENLRNVKMTGLRASFSVAGANLNVYALNTLFESLGEALPGAILNIAGCPGEDECNIEIAEAKGWEVEVTSSDLGLGLVVRKDIDLQVWLGINQHNAHFEQCTETEVSIETSLRWMEQDRSRSVEFTELDVNIDMALRIEESN